VARNIFVSKRDEVRRDGIIWHNLRATLIKYGVIKLWRVQLEGVKGERKYVRSFGKET